MNLSIGLSLKNLCFYYKAVPLELYREVIRPLRVAAPAVNLAVGGVEEVRRVQLPATSFAGHALTVIHVTPGKKYSSTF